MTRFAYLSLLLGSMIPACADPDPDVAAPIEVRPAGGAPVAGTVFACSDHAPTTTTPCDPYSQQRTVIGVQADAERGVVELGLSRNSEHVQVDGPGVVAVLVLAFEGERLVRAAARQDTFGELGVKRVASREGWIEPVAASRAADQRNAGRFSLTFDWGVISGAYDSVDVLPARAR